MEPGSPCRSEGGTLHSSRHPSLGPLDRRSGAYGGSIVEARAWRSEEKTNTLHGKGDTNYKLEA